MNRFINLRMRIDPRSATHRPMYRQIDTTKLSWLFPSPSPSPSPLARFDNCTVHPRSFNLSGCRDGRPTKINFYYWRGETDAARSRSLLLFESLLPSKGEILSTVKRKRESFPLYEEWDSSRERRKKKKESHFIFNFICIFIYDVHFIFVYIYFDFEYRITCVQWTNDWLDFHVNFFHSKRNPCLLIIISVHPISCNYKIPFRFALFEQKSFLTIRRNF